MKNGKLQVGIVGMGGIGSDKHLPGWAKVPFAEVSAAADISEVTLSRVGDQFAIPRRFSDWHELMKLDDLDIIDICTPNRTHAPIALGALESGKNVLCEKPLATTVEEVIVLRDAALRQKRVLMAAQHLRFDPTVLRLKSLVDAGMLGEIYYARAQWLRRRYVPVRPTFIEKRLSGGGPVFDVGVHVLDLAYWFLGSPQAVSVSALVDTKLAHRPDVSGSWGDWNREIYDVEDFAVGFVRFGSGATLTLEASWLGFQPEREMTRLQCFGTKSGLIWPEAVISGETNRVPWNLTLDEVPKQSAHHEMIYQFGIAVRDDLPSPVSVEESLSVIRILEGFYQSARAKREVPVE